MLQFERKPTNSVDDIISVGSTSQGNQLNVPSVKQSLSTSVPITTELESTADILFNPNNTKMAIEESITGNEFRSEGSGLKTLTACLPSMPRLDDELPLGQESAVGPVLIVFNNVKIEEVSNDLVELQNVDLVEVKNLDLKEVQNVDLLEVQTEDLVDVVSVQNEDLGELQNEDIIVDVVNVQNEDLVDVVNVENVELVEAQDVDILEVEDLDLVEMQNLDLVEMKNADVVEFKVPAPVEPIKRVSGKDLSMMRQLYLSENKRSTSSRSKRVRSKKPKKHGYKNKSRLDEQKVHKRKLAAKVPKGKKKKAD